MKFVIGAIFSYKCSNYRWDLQSEQVKEDLQSLSVVKGAAGKFAQIPSSY